MSNKMAVFDAIAAIHIYFSTDLLYKKEAQKAFNWIKKNREKVIPYLNDVSVLDCRRLDDADHHVFWRAYNRLFEKEVLSRFPELQPSHDQWGARCFKINEEKILCGDSYDCYPFYLDKESLYERLNDLANELVC